MESIFALSMPVSEIAIRGTVMFLAVTVLMRIVGQRESGGLGLTDVLLVVLVADAAGAGLSGNGDSIADGLLLVGVILFWSVMLDAVAYRSRRFATLLKGQPKPLIESGRLDRAVMRRELITDDEVMSQLRLHGIVDLAAVDKAYLEPNGMISIISRDDD